MVHQTNYFTWLILKIVLVEQELDKKYCWKTWKILRMNKIYNDFILHHKVLKNLEICLNTINTTLTILFCILKNILKYFTAFMKRKSTFNTKGWKQFLILMNLKILILIIPWTKIFLLTQKEPLSKIHKLSTSWISYKLILLIQTIPHNQKLFLS